jgi:streptogramin lyase
MRMALLLVVLAACARPAPASPPRETRYHTEVVEIPAGDAVSVLQGPFEVFTINPGSNLRLAVAKSCDDAAWFTYSGGGVAVGAGETLCAWSLAEEPAVHGFSGHD